MGALLGFMGTTRAKQQPSQPPQEQNDDDPIDRSYDLEEYRWEKYPF
jgi:hypothetical protein